jgi:AraC-like DNA-binding protein
MSMVMVPASSSVTSSVSWAASNRVTMCASGTSLIVAESAVRAGTSGLLTWWRKTKAARILRDSDAPLNAVATKVGYTSEFAFAAAFKRVLGTAPGRYRRQSSAM